MRNYLFGAQAGNTVWLRTDHLREVDIVLPLHPLHHEQINTYTSREIPDHWAGGVVHGGACV